MLYAIIAFIAVCVLALAGKDADSYLLMLRTAGLTWSGRINRWHRDGVILFGLYLAPLIMLDARDWWKILIAAGLLRLSLFDLAFNRWAGLPVRYLGGTARTDKVMVGIFGTNGAITKSFVALAILAAGIILNIFL